MKIVLWNTPAMTQMAAVAMLSFAMVITAMIISISTGVGLETIMVIFPLII